jgi:rhamnogalacturonyl hydrolase YesR
VNVVPDAASLKYVLMTAAHNEADLIDQPLRSVTRQTILPIRWIVVSDGSTDATEEIVETYVRDYPWIELLRLEGGPGRNLSRKARALNTAHARLRDVAYDVIGIVDADVSFDEKYIAFLLERFVEAPGLGVAGTAMLDGGLRYDYDFTSASHVSGSCQFFRRECFEQLGGFVPAERGGVDWIAVTTARMIGWETRAFLEKESVHHRPIGSSGKSVLKVWLERGLKDYSVGFHPVWEIARSIYQATSRRPYLIGGTALLAGYTYGAVTRTERHVSKELMQFNRDEQRRRLKEAVLRLVNREPHPDVLGEADTSWLPSSIDAVERWIEAHDYKGYEPFDGLSSYLRPLTFDRQLLEQMLLHVGRQSPINLRRLLGIAPLDSTKGRGYVASGYLARLQETGAAQYEEKAAGCLEWLIDNKSPLYPDFSWGNHFDYVSRTGRIGKHESTIVWTSLIGQAFLDAYEIVQRERYLDIARSICEWILKLPRERTAAGTCLSYLRDRQISIHNSNLLGAALLARTARYTAKDELLDVARAAVEYSCARQLPSGAWYYGDAPTHHWIDCFHTGYNLDSLKGYLDAGGDPSFRPHLDLGFRYFKKTFIEPGGRPKYYHDRTYPIDIQCAAQAIETLSKFAGDDPEALPAALRVARWTVANMQDARGYFWYRKYPLLTARIPMFHWGQATMYRALALLSLQLVRRTPSTR